jgi:two-component system invasion response regulator UvrY
VRVFLVEDQTLFSTLLVTVLARTRRFEVVGTAATAEAAIRELASATPDLVLVDLVLPDMSGFELIARLVIGRPAFRIVVCSAAAHDEAIAMAFALGAHGFVAKKDGIPALLETLERAADGLFSLSSQVSTVLRGRLQGRPDRAEVLPGDLGVLRRLARRESVADISRAVGLSPSGVYKVRQRLARCLGARTKSDFFRAAERLGLVEGGREAGPSSPASGTRVSGPRPEA